MPKVSTRVSPSALAALGQQEVEFLVRHEMASYKTARNTDRWTEAVLVCGDHELRLVIDHKRGQAVLGFSSEVTSIVGDADEN
jgi:hypothetical protein